MYPLCNKLKITLDRREIRQISIAEIEIFDILGANIAYNKPVTMSSFIPPSIPENAVDGNKINDIPNLLAISEKQIDPWIEINFEGMYRIREIRIYPSINSELLLKYGFIAQLFWGSNIVFENTYGSDKPLTVFSFKPIKTCEISDIDIKPSEFIEILRDKKITFQLIDITVSTNNEYMYIIQGNPYFYYMYYVLIATKEYGPKTFEIGYTTCCESSLKTAGSGPIFYPETLVNYFDSSSPSFTLSTNVTKGACCVKFEFKGKYYWNILIGNRYILARPFEIGDKRSAIFGSHGDNFVFKFIDKGEANSYDLFKIANYFINKDEILKLINVEDIQKFCGLNPYNSICNKYCPPDSNIKDCILTWRNKCFKTGNTCNILHNKECQIFCSSHSNECISELDKNNLCKKDNLLNSPFCNDFYMEGLRNCDKKNNLYCSQSRKIFNDICKDNIDDPRCKCINKKQRDIARDKELEKYVDMAKYNVNKQIDEALKDPKFPENLKEPLEKNRKRAIDTIIDYFAILSFGSHSVPSQCLIRECRDGTLPVIDSCKITTFILAVCFQSIDIRALAENSRIIFTGNTHICNININLGNSCKNDSDCKSIPGGKCINGTCVLPCENGKCQKDHICVNGYCLKKTFIEECNDTKKCPEGFFCSYGKCLPIKKKNLIIPLIAGSIGLGLLGIIGYTITEE